MEYISWGRPRNIWHDQVNDAYELSRVVCQNNNMVYLTRSISLEFRISPVSFSFTIPLIINAFQTMTTNHNHKFK